MAMDKTRPSIQTNGKTERMKERKPGFKYKIWKALMTARKTQTTVLQENQHWIKQIHLQETQKPITTQAGMTTNMEHTRMKRTDTMTQENIGDTRSPMSIQIQKTIF